MQSRGDCAILLIATVRFTSPLQQGLTMCTFTSTHTSNHTNSIHPSKYNWQERSNINKDPIQRHEQTYTITATPSTPPFLFLHTLSLPHCLSLYTFQPSTPTTNMYEREEGSVHHACAGYRKRTVVSTAAAKRYGESRTTHDREDDTYSYQLLSLRYMSSGMTARVDEEYICFYKSRWRR